MGARAWVVLALCGCGANQQPTVTRETLGAVEPGVCAQSVVTTSPLRRANTSLLWDSTHSRAVLFGGNDASTYLNDLWIADGSGSIWTQLCSGA